MRARHINNRAKAKNDTNRRRILGLETVLGVAFCVGVLMIVMVAVDMGPSTDEVHRDIGMLLAIGSALIYWFYGRALKLWH